MSPAQLASLPHELKVKIADECHAADQRIDELFEDLERLKTYPSAISALYGTSKEWQSIVVGHRFERVSSSQMAKPLFQIALAPKYGHLIREASLAASATAEHLASFVGSLDRCPNLRSLDIKDLQTPMNRLLASAGSSATAEAVSALAHACSQLRSLTLGNARSAYAIELLAATTRLRHLSITFIHIAEFHDLWKLLKRVPGLTALDLVLPAPSTAHPACLATVAASAPKRLPPITRLKVESRAGPVGLAQFVSLFALQSLSLKAGNFAGFAVSKGSDIFTDQSALPLLSRLELAGEATALGRILDRLEPERLPGLRHLCVYPNHASRTIDLFSSVKSAVLQHVDVSRVEYFTLISRPRTHHSSSFFEELGVDYVSSPHGIALAHLDKRDVVHFLSAAQSEGPDLRAGTLAIIDKTLDHIVRVRNLAALHDDTASYARLAELLRPFDHERALYEA